MDKQSLLEPTQPPSRNNYGGITEAVVPSDCQGTVDAPISSLPPMTMLREMRVVGYEDVTFLRGDCGRPPTYEEVITAIPLTVPPCSLPTSVSDDEARQSLVELAAAQCCWDSKFAREMDIISVTPANAFHYKLDTFTEKRKCLWQHEPYVDQYIDGPENGQPPAPWNIPLEPNRMFDDHQKCAEVPHTDYVKHCHDCSGSGANCCTRCNGTGKILCSNCSGHGYYYSEDNIDRRRGSEIPCLCCNETGKVSCGVCHGYGQVDCSTCHSNGKLRYFIGLTVEWKNHSSGHIVENTGLPNDIICTAGCHVVFEDSGLRVAPVSNFESSSISRESQRLVQQHNKAFPNRRIIQQRHQVRVVPVSEITSEYKSQRFTYWVYGTGNTAYAPDYPQKCCCGCSIL